MNKSTSHLYGVDNNDQTKGTFRGSIGATFDFIEEFRVTTSDTGADCIRSSVAQADLTKRGTNNISGKAMVAIIDNRPFSIAYAWGLQVLSHGPLRCKVVLYCQNNFRVSLLV